MSFLSRIIEGVFKRSGVEAGGGGRRWDGASLLSSPQQQTLSARGTAEKRAGGLYVNSPLAKCAVEKWTSALVGKGWQTRPQHHDEDTRRTLSQDFEALYSRHLVALARGVVRDGEAFMQIVVTSDRTMRLKQIAPDQVDPSLSRDLANGGRIIAGIEFDAEDNVVAYHVLRDAPGTPFASYSAPVRIIASDMLHVFDAQFPGQVRGLSWLAPAMLKLRDRDEASDAMLMQLKVASLITGFIRDVDGTAAGFDGESPGWDGNVSLEPGAMRVLPQGAELTFSQPGQGLAQAIEFIRSQDREIAAGLGLTYEALTGDMGQANYSSARVGLLEFRRHAEMMQRNLIEEQFLRPLWNRWIDFMAFTGFIPGNQIEAHREVRFVPPGWQWVDPRNEVQADVAAINAGLKSREEVVAGRGRDIDELDAERARDTEKERTNQTQKENE